MQNLAILGATGSIGLSALDIVRQHPEKFNVYAISGFSQIDKLVALAIEFNVDVAVVPNAEAAAKADALLKKAQAKTQVSYGSEALIQIASCEAVDTVVAAIVGAAGLMPCLAAAKASKRILLANKEALVMSGQLFIDEVKKSNAELLPVDSEHNAIFQSLPQTYQQHYLNNKITDFGVNRIILTGSGGPFRETPLAELSTKTPAQACDHPNWSMGQKISVDSASMMNKGLEFIEACYLFSVEPEFIEVLIHPQSVIHSMVRYQDGSVIAQMGQPDMKTPIAHAMAYPDRITSGVQPYDFLTGGEFSFSQPCELRYPNLYLAKEAFRQGQESTTILNAANEEHVALFLAGKINFTQIAQQNEAVLNAMSVNQVNSVDDILAIDLHARKIAHELSSQLMGVSR